MNTARAETRVVTPRECKRCGGVIKGRRRNGFCSGRCRQAANREREIVRRRQLMERFWLIAGEIQRELLGSGSKQMEEARDAR